MSRPASHSPRFFSLRRILLPAVLVLASMAWFFHTFYDAEALKSIEADYRLFFWISVALSLVALRVFGYVARLRLLSGGLLSWKQAVQLIFLWEYASAVTPSTVGGSAVAVYLLIRERIAAARSTAMVLAATFLDEVYFILLVPVFYFWLGRDLLFGAGEPCAGVDDMALGGLRDLIVPFAVGYSILLLLTAIIGIGLFLRPALFRAILQGVTALPLLRKFREKAGRFADDMDVSAAELSGRPAGFWLAAFGFTALSWTARYLALNALFIAFTGFAHVLEIFARQFVMWVIMLIPATPGSSLIAETVFTTQLCPYLPVALLPVVLVLWRMLTYLPYLFIGPAILPFWLRRTGR